MYLRAGVERKDIRMQVCALCCYEVVNMLNEIQDYQIFSIDVLNNFKTTSDNPRLILELCLEYDAHFVYGVVQHKFRLLLDPEIRVTIESLNDNPTPDCVLKSPSLFPIPVEDSDSFFKKSDTSLSYSDNSLLEFETFLAIIRKKTSIGYHDSF
ncbi:hypothetical protein Tco_1291750 [Tanacetum coccineum]